VLQSHKLAADEQAFILMSLVPNRKGHPLLSEWQVACRRGQGAFALEPFEQFIERAGIKAGALPNKGQGLPTADLQAALPEAVQAMRTHMLARQAAFAQQMQTRLQGTLAELERLQGKQMRQLQLDLDKGLEGVARSRFERRSQQVHRVFDDYRQWVKDTLTTEPQPYIQVLAAVCA
jgi:hypothetical protein